MPRLRARTVIASLLSLGMTYCSYNFLSAGPRVQALCRQITPGMTLDTLRPFAQAHGLAPLPADPHYTGLSTLVETRSYGRHGCALQWQDGRITAVRDHFAD